MKYNREKHHRRSVRLKGYNYSSPGAYFVTICTWNRNCIFGEIINGTIKLNAYGEIAEICLKEIHDHFPRVDMECMVIMPNHVHMILIIDDPCPRRGVACNAPTCNDNYYSKIAPKRNTLSIILRSYKSAVTRQINDIRNTPGMPVWQRNYFERVIRNEKELFRIKEYIRFNPVQWDMDEENPDVCTVP